MRVFSCHSSEGKWWFRIFGYGLSAVSVNSDRLPFSIRYGYTKPLKIFGYYIQVITKNDF